jgi:tagatose 1,6-diphosphate aldolase
VLLYYSPFEPESVKEIKHAFVARIGAECTYYQVPFFLEFVGYDPSGGDEKGLDFAKQKPAIVSGSMKEFSKPEYNVDVLKVEVPVNMEYVEGSRANKSGKAAYTKKEAMDHFRRAADVASLPFIYLSAGVSDDVFRETLELAIEAGTNFAGVLCGRATWKDGIPIYAKQGLKALEDWLNDRGVQNITALNSILKRAHPWYEKYGGLDKIQVV